MLYDFAGTSKEFSPSIIKEEERLERCSSTSSKKGIFRWPQHIQKDFLPKMPDDRLMLERLASAETERDNFHKQHFRSNQNWTMLHNLETSMTEQVKKDLSTWMAK